MKPLDPKILAAVLVSTLVSTLAAASAQASTAQQGEQAQPASSAPEEQQAPAPTGEPAEREAEKPSNTLRWATASELDNFGYDVYRSESEEGPFERLNAEPIPGSGTTDEPSHYVYVDDTIDPTKIYYYYVESISLGGVRERFTPVYKVPAKRPPADQAAAEEQADPPPAEEPAAGEDGPAGGGEP
jgi:hypothetical protein